MRNIQLSQTLALKVELGISEGHSHQQLLYNYFSEWGGHVHYRPKP